MKKVVLFSMLGMLFFNSVHAQSLDSFFDQFDQFLTSYTEKGYIDFDRLKADPGLLNELYETIGKVDLKGQDEVVTKAFLINAYNLLVIKQEQVFYPIKSPLEIDGFFSSIVHQVAGKEYTLDALEKEYLLKQYPDARVHLVLVCGAKGCPKLFEKAYRPETLDQQIDDQVKNILNDPDFLIVSDDKTNIALSEIFKWYQQDFIQQNTDVLDYINQYRTEKLSKESVVSYYEYDWSINTISKDDD